MVICWKILFCGMHCFMISICDAEPEFSDDINERHLLLNHHKWLEQLKNLWAWKTAAIKVTTKYKKHIKFCYHWEKRKTISLKYFQINLLVSPSEPSMWRYFVRNIFVDDDDDIQLVKKRFDTNTYCTVSGGNFVYSFSFLKNWTIQSYSATYDCASLTF